jgi:hypothetical protein
MKSEIDLQSNYPQYFNEPYSAPAYQLAPECSDSSKMINTSLIHFFWNTFWVSLRNTPLSGWILLSVRKLIQPDIKRVNNVIGKINEKRIGDGQVTTR